MSSFAPPSTPPRKAKTKFALETPQSSTKKVQNFFSSINGKRTNLAPVTPDFTPQKSPRIQRKKNIESIFTPVSDTSNSGANSSTNTGSNLSLHPDSFGLLLPTPSTVGSGRKYNANSVKLKPATLKFDTLLLLNDSLKFESDDEDETFQNSMLKSPTPIKLKNPFVDQNTKPPKFELKKPQMAPQTPKKQLIDDDKINDWHGQSKYFSDDDIDVDEVLSSRKPLVNPFVGPVKTQSTYRPKLDVDYRTHLELVNNKTGEKKVVKLLDRQVNIRPKKLDFSKCNGL